MMGKMKDSGVEWSGEIPEGWEETKLKNIATVFRGGSPRPIEDYITDEDDGLNWIKIGDTQKGYKFIDTVHQKIRKDGLSKTRIVNKGDLILTNSMSFGEPYILNIDGCIHDGWVSLHQIKIDKLFLYYLLSSNFCTEQFNILTSGGVVQNLNISKIGSIFVLFPPLIEQKKISTYLDHKCAQIDAILASILQSIEKLKEYRQAVITRAVTKGLDPDAKMKDSGVKWIGEIPENWEKHRLRFLCKISTGDKDTKDKIPNGKYPFFVRSPEIERIDSYSYDGEAVLMAGDGVGAGKVFHYFKGRFNYHQRVYNLHQIKRINGRLLFYYLQAIFAKRIEEDNAKSTVDSVRLPMLLDFPVVFGTKAEQNLILSFIDQKTAQIDSLIAEKQKLHDKITAYKKSLIYEYVTGKREVPDGSSK